jgi:hypothetical protein
VRQHHRPAVRRLDVQPAARRHDVDETVNRKQVLDIARQPPLSNTQTLPSGTIPIDDSNSQVPFSAPSFYPDPIDPTDYNRISKPRWVTPMVTLSAT